MRLENRFLLGNEDYKLRNSSDHTYRGLSINDIARLQYLAKEYGVTGHFLLLSTNHRIWLPPRTGRTAENTRIHDGAILHVEGRDYVCTWYDYPLSKGVQIPTTRQKQDICF